MALPMVPYADAGPLYGLVLPILISVAVTPGVCAPAGASTPSASTAPRTMTRLRLSMMSSCRTRSNVAWSLCAGREPSYRVQRSGSRRGSAPCQPGQAESQRARDAARHHVHEEDQEHAVDGPRRRLGDVLRPVRHELDEEAAEDRPGDGGEPADHDTHEERERQEHVEGVGR